MKIDRITTTDPPILIVGGIMEEIMKELYVFPVACSYCGDKLGPKNILATHMSKKGTPIVCCRDEICVVEYLMDIEIIDDNEMIIEEDLS